MTAVTWYGFSAGKPSFSFDVAIPDNHVSAGILLPLLGAILALLGLEGERIRERLTAAQGPIVGDP